MGFIPHASFCSAPRNTCLVCAAPPFPSPQSCSPRPISPGAKPLPEPYNGPSPLSLGVNPSGIGIGPSIGPGIGSAGIGVGMGLMAGYRSGDKIPGEDLGREGRPQPMLPRKPTLHEAEGDAAGVVPVASLGADGAAAGFGGDVPPRIGEGECEGEDGTGARATGALPPAATPEGAPDGSSCGGEHSERDGVRGAGEVVDHLQGLRFRTSERLSGLISGSPTGRRSAGQKERTEAWPPPALAHDTMSAASGAQSLGFDISTSTSSSAVDSSSSSSSSSTSGIGSAGGGDSSSSSSGTSGRDSRSARGVHRPPASTSDSSGSSSTTSDRDARPAPPAPRLQGPNSLKKAIRGGGELGLLGTSGTRDPFIHSLKKCLKGAGEKDYGDPAHGAEGGGVANGTGEPWPDLPGEGAPSARAMRGRLCGRARAPRRHAVHATQRGTGGRGIVSCGGRFAGENLGGGNVRRPRRSPRLTLPHARTALPKPPHFATCLKDETFPRNGPPPPPPTPSAARHTTPAQRQRAAAHPAPHPHPHTTTRHTTGEQQRRLTSLDCAKERATAPRGARGLGPDPRRLPPAEPQPLGPRGAALVSQVGPTTSLPRVCVPLGGSWERLPEFLVSSFARGE